MHLNVYYCCGGHLMFMTSTCHIVQFLVLFRLDISNSPQKWKLHFEKLFLSNASHPWKSIQKLLHSEDKIRVIIYSLVRCIWIFLAKNPTGRDWTWWKSFSVLLGKVFKHFAYLMGMQILEQIEKYSVVKEEIVWTKSAILIWRFWSKRK